VFVGIQRILVAFDTSPHAEHALDVALAMAGDMKAKLFIVSVIRPPQNTIAFWKSNTSLGQRHVMPEPACTSASTSR
jgi:K+-sensing histidine kinase KdpD